MVVLLMVVVVGGGIVDGGCGGWWYCWWWLWWVVVLLMVVVVGGGSGERIDGWGWRMASWQKKYIYSSWIFWRTLIITSWICYFVFYDLTCIFQTVSLQSLQLLLFCCRNAFLRFPGCSADIVHPNHSFYKRFISQYVFSSVKHLKTVVRRLVINSPSSYMVRHSVCTTTQCAVKHIVLWRRHIVLWNSVYVRQRNTL